MFQLLTYIVMKYYGTVRKSFKYTYIHTYHFLKDMKLLSVEVLQLRWVRRYFPKGFALFWSTFRYFDRQFCISTLTCGIFRSLRDPLHPGTMVIILSTAPSVSVTIILVVGGCVVSLSWVSMNIFFTCLIREWSIKMFKILTFIRYRNTYSIVLLKVLSIWSFKIFPSSWQFVDSIIKKQSQKQNCDLLFYLAAIFI